MSLGAQLACGDTQSLYFNVVSRVYFTLMTALERVDVTDWRATSCCCAESTPTCYRSTAANAAAATAAAASAGESDDYRNNWHRQIARLQANCSCCAVVVVAHVSNNNNYYNNSMTTTITTTPATTTIQWDNKWLVANQHQHPPSSLWSLTSTLYSTPSTMSTKVSRHVSTFHLNAKIVYTPKILHSSKTKSHLLQGKVGVKKYTVKFTVKQLL